MSETQDTKYDLKMLIAYILWFFIGGLGVHRFFLGRHLSGLFMMLLSIAGVITAPFIVGIPMLLIVGIWWLVDAYLIYKIVQDMKGSDQVNQSSVDDYTGPTETVEDVDLPVDQK